MEKFGHLKFVSTNQDLVKHSNQKKDNTFGHVKIGQSTSSHALDKISNFPTSAMLSIESSPFIFIEYKEGGWGFL